MTTPYDTILDYWFGPLDESGHVVSDRSALWWKKNTEVDREIRERFASEVEAVARGDRDHWLAEPRGRLAQIICLDQFPRNIYRGLPQSFEFDGKARDLSLAGLERSLHQQLAPIERVFFYLPLEHAEDRRLQARSVELYQELLAAVPAERRGTYQSYLDYALRHQEIIERFGRFPHRNEILARPSSEEEAAFLKEPGSSF